MIERFDIFAIEDDGATWLGTANDVQTARLRVAQMSSHKSAQRFLLLDQKTGKRTYITAEEIKSIHRQAAGPEASSVPA